MAESTANAPSSRRREWFNPLTSQRDLRFYLPPSAMSPTETPFGPTPMVFITTSKAVEAQLLHALVRDRFMRLADLWAEETAFSSSTETTVLHPAYQQIIGMGRDAIPLILQRLQDGLAYWFWALAAIAGEDPADGVVDPELARQRWLDWGRDRGYIG